MTKFWARKILAPKKSVSKMFGKTLGRHRGYIAGMYKCPQDNCCLNKCHPDIRHLAKMGPESYCYLKLVK